jgi:hypothetical protein
MGETRLHYEHAQGQDQGTARKDSPYAGRRGGRKHTTDVGLLASLGRLWSTMTQLQISKNNKKEAG